MDIAELTREARAFIGGGGEPKTVHATNAKTGLSICDNVPHVTCAATCPVASKCYDIALLGRYPNALKARFQRHFLMLMRPDRYVEKAIGEIRKKRKKPDKIRVYGGGDFHPAHVSILRAMLRENRDVTYYAISKTIRNWPNLARELLSEPNFFLNLSEMHGFQFGDDWRTLRKHDRVNSVWTLMAGEANPPSYVDIVFNVDKGRGAIEAYRAAGVPLCPCDAKDIPVKKACENCGLCATKGGVRAA